MLPLNNPFVLSYTHTNWAKEKTHINYFHKFQIVFPVRMKNSSRYCYVCSFFGWLYSHYSVWKISTTNPYPARAWWFLRRSFARQRSFFLLALWQCLMPTTIHKSHARGFYVHSWNRESLCCCGERVWQAHFQHLRTFHNHHCQWMAKVFDDLKINLPSRELTVIRNSIKLPFNLLHPNEI